MRGWLGSGKVVVTTGVTEGQLLRRQQSRLVHQQRVLPFSLSIASHFTGIDGGLESEVK
jgi:hypothetical protein